MTKTYASTSFRRFVCALFCSALLLSACATSQTTSPATSDATHQGDAPQLTALALKNGETLRVVATTSLIGDAVRRVGGEEIELTVLMAPGVDPHTYTATPQDMATLSDAHLIFLNGFGLEESLMPTLEGIDGGAARVVVNSDVEAIEIGPDEHADEHEHTGGDPHTWQDVNNVILWVNTIAQTLQQVDPPHATVYRERADAYTQQLTALDQELRTILAAVAEPNRKLVTDHDNLQYFGRAYQFTIVGAVIPSFSTMATISAEEMVNLQRQIEAEKVKAIFVGATVNPKLASQVAADTGIHVVTLYTDSLSVADGPAATYEELMRSNAIAIADALK